MLQGSENDNSPLEKELSEDVIKRVALPFLKGHYKFRSDLMESNLEVGALVASHLDLRTKEGYVVDGFISFQQKTGETFIATFEATSAAKRDEVIYKIRYPLMVWDGLALSFLLMTFILTIAYVQKWFDFQLLGLPFLIASLLFLICLLTLLFRVVFTVLYKGVDRYHYIYAVEQFKKYRANEQWIAFGEDVFAESLDPHFLELRDQCTKEGFGMIKITKDLKVIKILTPARSRIGDNRRFLDFVTQKALYSKLKKMSNHRFFRRTAKDIERYTLLRFQRNYFPQMGAVGVSILLLASIFWKEFSAPALVYESEKDRNILATRQTKQQVDKTILIDSLDELFIQSYDTTIQNYLALSEEDRPSYNLKQRKKSSELFKDFTIKPIATKQDSSQVTAPKMNYGIYLIGNGSVFARLSCKRIASKGNAQFIIQESIFPDSLKAFEQAALLYKEGVGCNIFWMGCTNTSKDSFVVFVDLLYDSLQLAQRQAIYAQRILDEKGLTSKLYIRPVLITQ